jgi:hypothetical protein
MKQFDNLPLQQGSHARMQFGIQPLQQGNTCLFTIYLHFLIKIGCSSCSSV